MNDYFMLILATLLLGLDFAVNKVYQNIYGTKPKAALFFNSILGLSTAIIFFFVNGMKLDVSLFSCVMAGLMSALVMSYNIIGFQLLKSGTMAMYTLFLMTGGMVLPYIWGLIFLDEPFSLLRTVGLLIIMLGVVLPNFSQGVKRKQLLMCAAVFVINGGTSIVSKMHQIESTLHTVNTNEFIIWSGIFKFIIAGVLFLIFGRRDEDSERRSLPKALAIIIGSAVLNGSFFMIQLAAASNLPATVLYPFVTGGCIIFSSLAGVIFFKEKLSLRIILSIALCFVGTLMFL